MKNYLILALFIFFVSCSSEHQIIEGKVIDENNQPIQDVLVQVMGTDLFEYTNEDGYFKIDTKSRGAELIFNKEGYEFQRKCIDEVKEVQLAEKD